METKLFAWVRVLAIIGITLAIYLLYEQITLPEFNPCRINAVVNCDAVITGEVAKTLGIPTPLYGLVGYIVIFFAAQMRNRKLLFSMATFGLAFCAYIGYRELWQLRVICPICIGCQIDMIITFILALKLRKNKQMITEAAV